jgi:hypothetical protein
VSAETQTQMMTGNRCPPSNRRPRFSAQGWSAHPRLRVGGAGPGLHLSGQNRRTSRVAPLGIRFN